MMLTATALNYKVGKHHLLRDISFQIRPGELLAVLGANGAGKSTLINILSGEKKPTSGKVLLFDKELSSYLPQELAKKRTILQQHNSVHLNFSVNEVLLMGRYPHFRFRPDIKDLIAVEEAMEVCGISHLVDRSYLSLSGGEQQRVQYARVLCQIWDQPESLLLMDEPVAALDPQYQQQTMAIARAFSQRGYMVIAVLHEINLAAQYADRILMLKGGRKWLDGTPVEVLTPSHIYAIFSTEVDVMVNKRTLQPIVIPKQINLDINRFNSLFYPIAIGHTEVTT
ncbi:heme ABC transporter ATP-binding protein [Olivibacter jilunii]|uniref:heme ABC transporter ATP-binding protein n=1 Tax=Olivibacter jilunii TaxID=985016 RepID=UPI003F5CC374